MPQNAPFRILLMIAAFLALFVIAAHAESAKPSDILGEIIAYAETTKTTDVLNELLTRQDVPKGQQKLIRSTVNEILVSQRPFARLVHLKLVANLYDLTKTQEELASASAVAIVPSTDRQMLQMHIDMMRTILPLLEERMAPNEDQVGPEF